MSTRYNTINPYETEKETSENTYAIPLINFALFATASDTISTFFINSRNAPTLENLVDIPVDMETPESTFASGNALLPYFEQFMDETYGISLLPTTYDGVHDLGENVLGQAAVTMSPYGPIESRVSLSEDFYNNMKRLQEKGYDVLSSGSLLGVQFHEYVHSTGILDEKQTREVTREFFDWFKESYLIQGSPAYDKATIAAEVGGAIEPEYGVSGGFYLSR